MRPSAQAQERRIRALLHDGHDARAVAAIVDAPVRDVASIEGEMVRDCLAGTANGHRPRPPGGRHSAGSGRNGVAMKELMDSAHRAAAHARRCRMAGPPPSDAEAEALKAEWLKTHTVTVCPPGHAQTTGHAFLPTPTVRSRRGG